MLTVIGDLAEDIVVRHSGSVVVGTDNPAKVVRRRGGSAANVAACAAPLVTTRLIGRVGLDLIGDGLVASLEAAGVEVLVQRGGATGTVVVLVDDTGERTMFPDRAAASELATIDPTWLVDTSVLHVPAYGFGSAESERVLLEAIGAARRSGARLSVDLSATSLMTGYGLERFRTFIENLRPDILFANADEAALFGLLERNPEPGCVWIVKNGPRPAVVLAAGARRAQVNAVPAVPLARVANTTGAGDAFAAGYLAATISGSSPVEAAAAGHRCAASALQTD